MLDKPHLADYARCTVAIGTTSLPRFLQSRLVQSVAREILRGEGEDAPFATLIDVDGATMSGPLQVEAVGPHADAVCAALPGQVADVLASKTFDSDGFVV